MAKASSTLRNPRVSEEASVQRDNGICPLCERPIPPGQVDAHHLIPKSKGGKSVVNLHRICHRQIHALLTESELASQYPTIDSLLQYPEMSRFIRWVRGKPADFFERTRKSKRIRFR
jgi:hypothetical protein